MTEMEEEDETLVQSETVDWNRTSNEAMISKTTRTLHHRYIQELQRFTIKRSTTKILVVKLRTKTLGKTKTEDRKRQQRKQQRTST